MQSRFSIVLGLLLLGAGCGGSTDDNRVSVSGEVRLDDQPLTDGVITFLPSDGKGPSASAKIVGGEYETKINPGPKNVSIQATQSQTVFSDSTTREDSHGGGGAETRGDSHGGGNASAPKQLIPAKYNTNTELTYEVKPDGNDDVNFDLKSK